MCLHFHTKCQVDYGHIHIACSMMVSGSTCGLVETWSSKSACHASVAFGMLRTLREIFWKAEKTGAVMHLHTDKKCCTFFVNLTSEDSLIFIYDCLYIWISWTLFPIYLNNIQKLAFFFCSDSSSIWPHTANTPYRVPEHTVYVCIYIHTHWGTIC